MAQTKIKLIADGTIVQSHLNASHGITTADIGENASYLYYTDARARAAVSVSGNALSYNSSTGVITSNYEESPTFTGNITFGDSHFIGDDADDNLLIQSSANENIIINSVDDLLLRTGGTTKLMIKNGGNVGIGVTSPNAKLKIEGNGATNGLSIKSAGNGGTYPFMVTWSGGTEGDAFCIDDNLNVGIGTDGPFNTLDIKHGTNNRAVFSDSSSYGDNVLIGLNDGGGEIGFGIAGSSLSFYTNVTERMIIDSSGTIGINKTSGLNAGGFGSPKIVIKQTTNNEWGGINIEAEGNDAVFGIGTSNDVHILAGSYRATAGFKDIVIKAGGAERLRVDNTQGYIGIGTTVPNQKLDVNGNIGIPGAGKIVFNNEPNAWFLHARATTSTPLMSTNLKNLLYCGGGASEGFTVTGTGQGDPSFEVSNDGYSRIKTALGISMNPLTDGGELYINNAQTGQNQGHPATSGSTQNAITRVFASYGTFGEVLDTGFNVSSSPYAWLQATNYTALNVNYNIVLNPNGGKVGIGETSPSRILHIKSTNDTRGILVENTLSTSYAEVHIKASREFRMGTGNSSSATDARDKFYVYDANASAHRFTIDSSGNVGIATTSPQTKLDVDGGVKAETVEYSWHRSNPITSTNVYRHYKTTLYAGAGNNTMHIMGGFTLKAYSYSSNGYGEGSCMFHNWSGILYNLSVTNRGQWSNFVRSPYISSDGYVVIVCEHNTYSQPIIDFYQFYTPYGWRSVSVSGDTTSNSLTGAY